MRKVIYTRGEKGRYWYMYAWDSALTWIHCIWLCWSLAFLWVVNQRPCHPLQVGEVHFCLKFKKSASDKFVCVCNKHYILVFKVCMHAVSCICHALRCRFRWPIRLLNWVELRLGLNLYMECPPLGWRVIAKLFHHCFSTSFSTFVFFSKRTSDTILAQFSLSLYIIIYLECG